MADTEQEKTEDPTDKRLSEAREKGDVPISPEVRHAVMFVAMLVLIGTIGANALASLSKAFIAVWGGADQFRFEDPSAQQTLTGLLRTTLMALGPVLGVLFAAAAMIFVVQGRPVMTWSRLAPKWNMLSPAQGLNRIFGSHALIEFAKSVLKAGLIVGIALVVIWPHRSDLIAMIGLEPMAFAKRLLSLLEMIFRPIVIAIAVLAGFDLFYQNRSYLQRMRMTMQEIRDEMKESEGDPLIKSKRRAIAMARARRRMMAAVPTASVIITNPTHFSVALKYDHGVSGAPVVVAKGVDNVAFKIREIAKEAGVPIVESPPLARALYAGVEIDHPIPVEHYKAVAEIIGYVMRLRKKVLS